MRATPNLPLLLVAALLVAACGATPVMAGVAASHPAGTGAPRHVTRSAPGVAPTGTEAIADPVDARPRHILFIGASLTEGWFASTKDRAYTALVTAGLAEETKVQVRTLSHPGATAEDVAQWDLAIPSDYVVLQVATNDFVKNRPVDVYAASYADILQRLRAASPKAELVCLGAWLDPSSVNRIGASAVDYDVATRDACNAVGGRYVDLSATYLDVRNHGPAGRQTYHGPGDLYHPNDRGHAAIAALILTADGISDDERQAA